MGESWRWFVPAEKTWMRSVRGVSCVAGGEGAARETYGGWGNLQAMGGAPRV